METKGEKEKGNSSTASSSSNSVRSTVRCAPGRSAGRFEGAISVKRSHEET